MTLDEIRAALQDRRLNKVSEATGLHRATIARIRDGRMVNPDYDTVAKLATYLGGRHDKRAG